MAEKDDWRLQGQERYLYGQVLVRRAYRQYATNPNWDHDHCQFCSAKFMLGDDPETLKSGYATTDDYRWICEACYQDFKEMFSWRHLSEIIFLFLQSRDSISCCDPRGARGRGMD